MQIKTVFLTLLILIALGGFGFCCGALWARSATPEQVTLVAHELPRVEDDIRFDLSAVSQTDAGALLDPAYTVDTSNFQQTLNLFFTAPTLFYVVETADAAPGAGDTIRKLRDPELMQTFAAACGGGTIQPRDEAAPKATYRCCSLLGEVAFAVDGEATVVTVSLQRWFQRTPTRDTYRFDLAKDITPPLKKTFQKIEKVGKPVTNDEFMGNFE